MLLQVLELLMCVRVRKPLRFRARVRIRVRLKPEMYEKSLRK